MELKLKKKYVECCCGMLPFAMPGGSYFSDFAQLALSERDVKYASKSCMGICFKLFFCI